jgi:hypothetical protein
MVRRGGASGRIVERVPGSPVFVPDRRDLPEVPVGKLPSSDGFEIGLPLVVRGAIVDGVMTVESYSLKRPQLPRELDSTLRPTTDRLLDAIDRVVRPDAAAHPDATNRRLLTGPGSLVDARAHETIQALVSAYATAIQRGRADDALAVATRWAELRPYLAQLFPSETKAIYGELDNYPPWRYEHIYRQSAAVVALADPGASSSTCSGVLIASNLVLTAAHCFSPTRLPQDQEVWFRYVDGPGNPPPSRQGRAIEAFIVPGSPEAQQRLLERRFGPAFLDYVVVRLKKSPDDLPLPVAAEPQCVRRAPLHKGDSVYVVGYPLGQPVQVHDSARVYLPHRVLDGEEFMRLRLNVDADLLHVPERDVLMKEFDSSYQWMYANGLTWRALFNVRDQGQPRMGIVADTFQGNSGGPVYERSRGQCVAGLLLAGASDIGVRRQPNWKEHERVLPMSSILDDLALSVEGQIVLQQMVIE